MSTSIFPFFERKLMKKKRRNFWTTQRQNGGDTWGQILLNKKKDFMWKRRLWNKDETLTECEKKIKIWRMKEFVRESRDEIGWNKTCTNINMRLESGELMPNSTSLLQRMYTKLNKRLNSVMGCGRMTKSQKYNSLERKRYKYGSWKPTMGPCCGVN